MADPLAHCPRCGAPLYGAAATLCPACLLKAALEVEPGAGTNPGAAGDTRLKSDPLADGETRLTPFGSARPAPTGPRGMPAAIGPYRLARVLGEGGMGVVYLAEQTEPIRRTVALKVIKLGMDTHDVVARFESERQALALMDHPNIARVIDAGATPDGRPFFVMEHVDGVPITDYCDEHRLSTRARLALVATICGAMQHAHQKGVIHRDLKPSNVLVAEQDGTPVPKIIDFGIAKATQQPLTERTMFTEQGQFIGTPEYMSPEQTGVGGVNVDATTDIYSLGVLLYELLAGALPFEPAALRKAGYAEMQRIIREDEPPKPSTRVSGLGATGTDVAQRRHTDIGALRKQLSGDLDWITLKAIEKDRTRRYASASEFAADIGRYLNDEPVLASPPSTGYRAQKFVRRHRLGVAAGSLVATAVIAGLVVSLILYARAETARLETDRQRLEAQRQAYVANLTLADVALKAFSSTDAQRYLEITDPALRGWEYRHLAYRADPSVITLNAPGNFFDFPFHSPFLFSADGKRVAWSTQTTIQVWDAASYRHLATFDRLDSILAVSPDVRFAVTKPLHLDKDFSIRVIDVSSRNVLATFAGHHSEVRSAVLSPDGRLAASRSIDDALCLWETATGRQLASFRGGSFVFRGDGAEGAFEAKGRVQLWRAQGVPRLLHTDGEPLSYSPDGRYLALAVDRDVRIVDIATDTLATILRGHQERTLAAAFSPDGARLASASADHTVRVWAVTTGQMLSVFPGHRLSTDSIAFDPAGERVFSAENFFSSGVIRVWDASSSGAFTRFGSDAEPVSSLAFSADGTKLVSGGDSGALTVWDMSRRDARVSWTGHAGSITAVAFDESGHRVASGSSDKTLKIWDAASGSVIASLTGHTDNITSVSFNRAGKLVVSTSRDKTVRVWDAATGHQLARRDLSNIAYSAAFAPDGLSAFVGFGNSQGINPGTTTLERWEWAANRVLAATDARDGGVVQSVALSPDGTRIAAAGQSGSFEVTIWDSGLQTLLGKLVSYEAPMDKVVFSADGRRLATTDHSRAVVRLWDAEADAPLLVLRLPDELVAKRADDRTGQVLELAGSAMDRLETLVGAQYGPTTFEMAISRDGERLVTSSGGGLYLWEARSSADLRARALVKQLYADLTVSDDVIARLSADAALPADVRELALRYAGAHGDSAPELNSDSWRVVKAPGAGDAAYRAALREAEIAARIAPGEENYLNTLALAQFRAGRYQDALDTTAKAAALRDSPSDDDAVVRVVAQLRLGRLSAAREELSRLASKSIENSDLKSLIAEAKALSNSLSAK